jgi:hypothetical protein
MNVSKATPSQSGPLAVCPCLQTTLGVTNTVITVLIGILAISYQNTRRCLGEIVSPVN